MSTQIDIMQILENIDNKFSKNVDFQKREFKIGGKFSAAMIFFDTIINKYEISDTVIKPLISLDVFAHCSNAQTVSSLIEGNTYLTNSDQAADEDTVIERLLRSDSALFVEGTDKIFLFNSPSTNVRQISEPSSESVTNSAKDSFIETLNLNLTTVRTRVKSPNLVIEQFLVGSQIGTHVAVVHYQGKSNPEILKEIKKVLLDGTIKKIPALSAIEEALTDKNHSIFPQVLYTERPDKFCANITEGYIGILVDGFPFSIVTPVTFLAQMQASEDYSKNSLVASCIRILRFVMLFVALTIPAIYISIITFHHDVMPSSLALSIIQARLEVPFDETLETLIMLLAFETLIEAGLRIPKNIGQTVSIVGGLIIGDAAVSAKLISPVVVIIVAVAAISSFTIPNQGLVNAVRIWRFVLAIFASLLGLFGFAVGIVILILQLSSLELFGVSFLAPFVSKQPKTKDTFFRKPFVENNIDPMYLNGDD